MGTVSIFVRRPDGSEAYVGEAKTLEYKVDNHGRHPRESFTSFTIVGEDLGPLSPQKLRRVEIKHRDGLFGSGLAFGVSPAVTHEDGRFTVFTERGLRIYASISQYQGLFPRDEIRFIDV